MEELKIGIIVAQIINFGVLFMIFKHFLGDKIVEMIKVRRKMVKDLENTELEIKQKIDSAKEESEKIIDEARNKAGIIEKDAESFAKKNKEKIISEAESQASSILVGAKNDIEKERLSMIGAIKKEVISLSLRLNEKLFNKEKVDKDFMEKELNSINF